MRKILNILTAPIAPLLMWFPLSVIAYLIFRCNAIVAVILGLAVVGAFAVMDSIEFIFTQVVQFVKFRKARKAFLNMTVASRADRKDILESEDK